MNAPRRSALARTAHVSPLPPKNRFAASLLPSGRRSRSRSAARRCIPRCAPAPFPRGPFRQRRGPARFFRDRASRCLRQLRRADAAAVRHAPAHPVARTSSSAAPAAPSRRRPLRGSSADCHGTPLRPQPRPNLAGQPAARPVVPPRPDMVARLQQQQTRPAPGQAAPQAPRPGMPTRSSTPVPGQPIYRGPIRPGQPVMRGPGVVPAHRTWRRRSAVFAGHARCIPLRLCAPSRRRRCPPPSSSAGIRPSPAAAIAIAIRSRKRVVCGCRCRGASSPSAPPPIDREITISEGITVKELSEKLGIKANLVIKKLVEKKIFATINQTLDVKMAEDLARDFGASTNKVSYEEESTQEIAAGRRDDGSRAARPRGHHHGPRRSRQDFAARRHSVRQCGRPRSRRHHAAHRRLSRREERPQDRVHRHARSRSVHPHARPRRQGHRYRGPGGGGRRRRDAADARSHRSRQGGRRSRSSSPSTKSTSPTRSRSASSSNWPIAACWPRTGAATWSWSRFRPKPKPISICCSK